MSDAVLRTLTEAGLAEKEARIYVALLSLGRGDVTQIAREADLKRPNCYGLLEGLEERGYVSAVPGSKVKQYIPADPTKILYHLQETTSVLRDMLPIIQAIYNQPGRKPRVHYFEGKKGAVSVYREINRFPEAFFISSADRYKRYMPDDYAYWINGLERKTIKYRAKFLLPKTPTDLSFAKKFGGPDYDHEIRWLPKERNISMEFALYGNKLAITSMGDPFFVVVIESENIRKSVQTIFDIIWDSAEKYKKK